MRLKLLIAFAFAVTLHATTARYNNWCTQGGKTVITTGVAGAPKVMGSYPQCQVAVYLTGTVTPATIYSDTINTPLANPFTGRTDGSFYFYADVSAHYDVTISGGGLAAPFTFGDVVLGGGGGGGGGGTVTQVNTTAPITGGPITTTGTVACPTCVTSAAALILNQIVLGAGGQAAATLGSLGTTTTVLHGNAAGPPSFGPVAPGDISFTGNPLQVFRITPNVTPAVAAFADPPYIPSADYNFPAQAPGGSISIGSNSITMAPCPLGVNGSSANHYLQLSGGTGTAEAALITGGTCTSGATTGTVIVTAANTHSGAWTVTSASGGIQEAVKAFPNGAVIILPAGTTTITGKVSFGPHHQFRGQGAELTILDGTGIPTAIAWTFEYNSAVQGGGYDINTSILFSDLTISALSGIKINAEVIPAFQGNILNAHFQRLRMIGTYATATDPNRFTTTVPTLTELRGYGVAIECNQCFDTVLSSNQIEYWGIGTYIQGDISLIQSSSRYAWNANDVWFDGTTTGAGSDKIINSEFLGNRRIPSVRLINTAEATIQNNYFENYCPSAQYLRSTGSAGLIFYSNRMDDPANAALCVVQGGPSATTTTPIISLDDANSDRLIENLMNIGPGAVPPLQILYNNWDPARPNFIQCLLNNQFFPCPNGLYQTPVHVFYPLQPGVLSETLNPYLARSNNVAADSITGPSATSFAAIWKQSSVLKQADNTTGRWVLNTGAAYIFNFNLQSSAYVSFTLRLTGRKIGTGAGDYSLTYTDAAGSTTTLSIGTSNFVNTTEVDTREFPVQLPAASSGPGVFALTLVGTNAEFEQAELIPVVPAPSFISTETGANNAIAGALPTVTVTTGQCVTVQLGHTLQAGANTFNLNATGAVAIKSHLNTANNIGTAYAATGRWSGCFNGTAWLDIAQ